MQLAAASPGPSSICAKNSAGDSSPCSSGLRSSSTNCTSNPVAPGPKRLSTESPEDTGMENWNSLSKKQPAGRDGNGGTARKKLDDLEQWSM